MCPFHADTDTFTHPIKPHHPTSTFLTQNLAMASKFLLALSLSLLLSVAVGERYGAGGERMGLRLSRPQQCRIQRISAVQPQKQIQSEGGLTEVWDEMEDQFQCVGAVAMRNTLRPNALSLPNYHPNPRLVYIERGIYII